MNWYRQAQETSVNQLDLSSFDAFRNSLAKLPKSQLDTMQKEFDVLRQEATQLDPEWIELYHGSPIQKAQNIKDQGFELGEGQRTGFMGSTKTVNNQGIFLTDNKPLANYFGSNRSTYGNDYEILTSYVDSTNIMDFNNAPREIVKLGLQIINTYENTKKTRLAQRDWWWLLDQEEFISSIKQHGFTGVKFIESYAINRSAGSQGGYSYLIFDPNTIKIKDKDIRFTLQDYYGWLTTHLN
tara:strand:+ start:2865 stop:3584 length:720 start_codon:yes stop_codon:yes gene_type:complete